MTFLTRNFDHLTPLAPKFPNFAIQILLFRLEHIVAVVTHAQSCATKFLHHLGTGCCLPKTTFMTKIGGRLGQGSIQKYGTPYVFLQPLKRGCELGEHPKNVGPPTHFCNQIQIWYINWAWDQLAKNRRLGPKLAGSGSGSGFGSTPKKFGTPYLFLQLLKLATSNFVHNLGLGLAYQKNEVQDRNSRGSGLGEHPKNNLGLLLISATVEASNFKFGTQLGFGTSLAKNNVQDQNWRGVGQESIRKKLVHNMSLGLPCQTQVLGPNQVQGLNQESTTPLPIMMMMQLCILRAIKN